MQLSAESLRGLLDLARASIVAKLGNQPEPTIERIDETLSRPAGCFVSLHELHTHALRGCVGRLDATDPLFKVIPETARNVLSDPRFTQHPVRLEDLPNIEIEISILSPLEPAQNPLDFDLLNDGIYLRIGQQSGCFLPQVARETGWTKEQLLDRLCSEKLGLTAPAWRSSDAALQRFSTIIIGPEPFVSSPR
jgi:AmmeMemoRadiSam system protein A